MKTPVLAYDLGGTKVAVAVVSVRGKILEEIRVPIQVERGKKAVLDHLGELGKNFLKKYPKIRTVGIASAGPLDPIKGVLLDPTNMITHGKSWGQVQITRELSKRLKRKVYLDNDAAAAILAEQWLGAARGHKNAMILTLGTGLGTGMICNGELVRSGRMLHPEAGHLIIRQGDPTARCGCGNLGCAEAFLSGKNFAKRFQAIHGVSDIFFDSAEKISSQAKKGEKRAVKAFEEYAELLATAIHNYVVLYAPEIVVLTGSFAEASDLYLDSTREHLEKLLKRRRVGKDLLPKIKMSTLKNRAGILGGAWIALRNAP